MFPTAVLWGLGVSIGAAIGAMLFVVLLATWNWMTKTEVAKRTSEINELSIAALNRRNELTEVQNGYLATIAMAADELVDGQ